MNPLSSAKEFALFVLFVWIAIFLAYQIGKVRRALTTPILPASIAA